MEAVAKWVNAKLTLAHSTPPHPWRGLKPGLEAQTASPPCSQCCMQYSFTHSTTPKHYTSHQGLTHIASILSLHPFSIIHLDSLLHLVFILHMHMEKGPQFFTWDSLLHISSFSSLSFYSSLVLLGLFSLHGFFFFT